MPTASKISLILWYIVLILTMGLFLTNLIALIGQLLNKFPIKKRKEAKVAAENLRNLKKLLDEGIISKEVFEEKSKKFIEEL